MDTETWLRPLDDRDLDAVFEMMADPVAVSMAAFTAADPTDRAAFGAHMSRVLANPAIDHRAITGEGGQLVGSIATFPSEDGLPEVTYWIHRDHWGDGHASRALTLMLAETRRPVANRRDVGGTGARDCLDDC